MKRILTVLLASLMVFAIGFFSLSAFGLPVNEADSNVFTADQTKVTENRFENMLNNNYAYGDEFESVEKILGACATALIDKADSGKIENSLIIDFAANMYGVDATVFSDEGKEPLDVNGFTEVLPKGYAVFTHEVTEILENADGTYTVYSNVQVESHDGNESLEAISTFAKSGTSRFGYVLLSSELLEIGEAIEVFVL